MTTNSSARLDHEADVRNRYGAAAKTLEPKLCCPTRYDARYLEVIPQEIIERDYGCGDPSAHVGQGETVIDLGSGTGKICYILSQKVGAEGCVVGVDMNDDMLALARHHRSTVAERIGYGNVSFVKARIQDMTLDLDRVAAMLRDRPIEGVEALDGFESACRRMRAEEPAIPTDFADAVVSNCVLNLVNPAEKAKVIAEIHRVLMPGGRAIISDIVCDETPTPAMMADPELWSDCISGAMREDEFLQAFERAGFVGIEILERQDDPWQVVDGLEFRSMTVRAWKGEGGPCLERNQAVVYRGPWREVGDDDGHRFVRGERSAVCDRTFRLLTSPNGPYVGEFEAIEPNDEILPGEAAPFSCDGARVRHPSVSKGANSPGFVPLRDGCCDDDSCS